MTTVKVHLKRLEKEVHVYMYIKRKILTPGYHLCKNIRLKTNYMLLTKGYSNLELDMLLKNFMVVEIRCLVLSSGSCLFTERVPVYHSSTTLTPRLENQKGNKQTNKS